MCVCTCVEQTEGHTSLFPLKEDCWVQDWTASSALMERHEDKFNPNTQSFFPHMAWRWIRSRVKTIYILSKSNEMKNVSATITKMFQSFQRATVKSLLPFSGEVADWNQLKPTQTCENAKLVPTFGLSFLGYCRNMMSAACRGPAVYMAFHF